VIDRSDEIAHLSILREILSDLDPHGEWQIEPLYLKWHECRYSLSQKEYFHLAHCLDSYRKRIQYQQIKQELRS